MNRSWRAHGLNAVLRRGMVMAALLSLLAGCGLTDSLFGSSSGSGTPPEPVPGPAANSAGQSSAPAAPAPAPAATQPAQNQTYPNLGTVPTQVPTTSTTAERQQVTSGLVADNQNAAYSDQPLTAQPAGQGAAPAPPPVPAPIPAPVAAAATSTATETAAAAVPAVASQTTTNQAMTSQATTETTPVVPSAAPGLTQPVAPPLPTAGVTPLAPPPNPLPPTPTAGADVSDGGSVIVDMSQIGGAPVAGSSYAPAPYAAAPGAVPGGGRPVAIIFFADASTGISDRDLTVLHDVFLLQQQQGGHLRLVGNASQRTQPLDPARHDQVNYRLSAARANAVARVLIKMGVPAGTISIMAAGSQAPVFYEFMPTGEAGNRRVDVFLDR